VLKPRQTTLIFRSLKFFVQRLMLMEEIIYSLEETVSYPR